MLLRPTTPEPITTFLAGLALVLAIAVNVSADPVSNVHLQSESTCVTKGGSTVAFPPGYFLSEAARAALDVALKQAQDSTTRLAAENASFRAQAPGWQPGWKTIAIALAVGAASILAIQHL